MANDKNVLKPKRNRRLLLAKGRKLTKATAERIIRRYYRNDPEGYASDLKITADRGETIIQWAEQLLDGV